MSATPPRKTVNGDLVLPPFGFLKQCHTMAELKEDIPLLYRVTHGRSVTYFNPNRNAKYAFVAYEHCRGMQDPEANNPEWATKDGGSGKPSFSDVLAYTDIKVIPSRYVSTTASLSFALYSAHVRALKWNTADVHIVVIDARQVADRAYTGLECLTTVTSADRAHFRRMGWKFPEYYRGRVSNLSNAMQEVFVADYIPSSAILGTISWNKLEAHLPPWYLKESQDPLFPNMPSFIRVNEAKGCMIRRTFYAIRENYSNATDGPDNEITRLQALRTAFVLLEDFLKSTPEAAFLDDSDFKDVKPFNDIGANVCASGVPELTPLPPLLVLVYLTHYILSFPAAPWARDGYSVPSDVPRSRFEYSGSDYDLYLIEDFVRRKVRERAETERLVSGLVAMVNELCESEMGRHVLTKRQAITATIQNVMEQRLYCFSTSHVELIQTSEVIASHLEHLVKVANVKRNEQEFVGGLSMLLLELVRMDLQIDDNLRPTIPQSVQILRRMYPSSLFPLSIPFLRIARESRSGYGGGSSSRLKRSLSPDYLEDTKAALAEGSSPMKREKREM